jgi:hypothetical protein
MKIVNLTPHAVTLARLDEACDELRIESTGCARVSMATHCADAVNVDGLPAFRVPVLISEPGRLTGLPAAEEGTLLLVSRMVAEAAPDRIDLVYPDDVVRDAKGEVLHCRALGRAGNAQRILEERTIPGWPRS